MEFEPTEEETKELYEVLGKLNELGLSNNQWDRTAELMGDIMECAFKIGYTRGVEKSFELFSYMKNNKISMDVTKEEFIDKLN